MLKVYAALLLCLVVAAQATPTPVVIWHGMGDSANSPESMGKIQQTIQKALPGVYIVSIAMGSSASDDSYNSFFMNVNDQLTAACKQLSEDPKLADGFNAVGFSQGGQFLRAYIQRCNTPKVLNLISIGGQHQGVYGMPNCIGENSTLCEMMRKMLNVGAYVSIIQEHLVQAEYWKDPFALDNYCAKSVFLADINNDCSDKKPAYKTNLMGLNKFVMVKFLNDTMVQPQESEWFGFYAAGQDKEIVPLRDSQLYKEDWLGLKQMDSDNKLVFIAIPGEHLQFTLEWFTDSIITPYLSQ
eukprot:gnl/Hemi2/21312_TR7074_c0_g1_i1.p1 gnl/Hemi2/21312_TR7074_c0_g1~~gnl/Hemi2/21312_TR7074_c0_g1_i1.p1  ORF type:complete len:298 (+),score=144.00 gnl/Hemi2/21312_TR7074_c0_g1_i1:37-930(+)